MGKNEGLAQKCIDAVRGSCRESIYYDTNWTDLVGIVIFFRVP